LEKKEKLEPVLTRCLLTRDLETKRQKTLHLDCA